MLSVNQTNSKAGPPAITASGEGPVYDNGSYAQWKMTPSIIAYVLQGIKKFNTIPKPTTTNEYIEAARQLIKVDKQCSDARDETVGWLAVIAYACDPKTLPKPS